MSKEDLYVQCRLEQELDDGKKYIDVAYIPERGAKVGAKVELKGQEGLWVVVSSGGASVPISVLREKQLTARATPSIGKFL